MPTADLAKAYPLGTPTVDVLPTGYPQPAVPAVVEGAAPLIALAKQDLAKRLSVPADQISVAASVAMDWPDSSLGCPQPGMAYAQVITPGYRITLAQAEKHYDYHTSAGDQLVLCESK